MGGSSPRPTAADGESPAARALSLGVGSFRPGGRSARVGSAPQCSSVSRSTAGTRNWFCKRYELLYEAKLIPEATRGNSSTSTSTRAALPNTPGHPIDPDHRRILATGIARLRAKIKYHPVVFELMPDTFTLLQLQRCVEALAGRQVHKPNFRRLIEQQELVEETGETSQDTGGRPAKLFRFRRAVLAERAIAGTKLPVSGLDKAYTQITV